VTSPPRSLQTLTGRYDRAAFEPQGGRARVRLAVVGSDAWHAVLDGGMARLLPADGDADATLTADPKAWTAIAEDVRGGMNAYHSGRLVVRRNLHLGVGFLAATSGLTGPGRLCFRMVATCRARLSTVEAGSGRPVDAPECTMASRSLVERLAASGCLTRTPVSQDDPREEKTR
jgi:hypothetical protein